MKYEIKNGKYIFEKDGVYFSLTLEQVWLMSTFCNEIKRNGTRK